MAYSTSLFCSSPSHNASIFQTSRSFPELPENANTHTYTRRNDSATLIHSRSTPPPHALPNSRPCLMYENVHTSAVPPSQLHPHDDHTADCWPLIRRSPDDRSHFPLPAGGAKRERNYTAKRCLDGCTGCSAARLRRCTAAPLPRCAAARLRVAGWLRGCAAARRRGGMHKKRDCGSRPRSEPFRT